MVSFISKVAHRSSDVQRKVYCYIIMVWDYCAYYLVSNLFLSLHHYTGIKVSINQSLNNSGKKYVTPFFEIKLFIYFQALLETFKLLSVPLCSCQDKDQKSVIN